MTAQKISLYKKNQHLKYTYSKKKKKTLYKKLDFVTFNYIFKYYYFTY